MATDTLNARRICFRLLCDVYFRDAYSNLALTSYLEQHKELPSQDKSFLGAIFYGVLTYTHADHFIDDSLSIKIKKSTLSAALFFAWAFGNYYFHMQFLNLPP